MLKEINTANFLTVYLDETMKVKTWKITFNF